MHPTRLLNLTSLLLIAAAVLFLAPGCTPRKFMVTEFVHLVQDGLPAIEQEQDLQLLTNAMPAHIKLLETVLASDPENRDLLILLARLYGGYAFAVLETEFEARHWGQPSVLTVALAKDKLEDAIVRYFQRGAQYALEALEINYPMVREQLQRPQSADRFIKSLTAEEVPALFWYGFNLGGYIQHRLDSISAISKAYQVERAMQRVVDLDQGYYHGGAHLILLAYYASRSAMTGGNPALAEAHFTSHQLLFPDATGLRQLYWARYMLVQRQEKEQFLLILNQVIQGLASGKRRGLLASVAATRAEIYLGSADQFFDPALEK